MRYWIAIFILGGVLGGAAIAQDADLRSLQTGVDASPWEAVGRLNIGGNSFCTGALIAPDIVLTAAHCLYNSDTGELDQSRPGRISGGLAQWPCLGLP